MMREVSRVVQVAQVAYLYLDFFQVDGTTRETGLIPSNFTLKAFWNGQVQSQTLLSGINVTDPMVTAGKAYLTEPFAGFYLLRFFPQLPGAWRLVVRYTNLNQEFCTTLDVVTTLAPVTLSTLQARFVP